MPTASTESLTSRRVTPPRTLSNVLSNWAGFAFSVGVNFFLAPFVVHRLGNTAYGTWVLLASVVGYMGLLDLGVRSAVMRYVARHHARVEDAEAGRAASAGLAIFTVAGLLAIVAAGIIAVFLDRLFKIPADMVGVARLVVLVGGVGVAVSLVGGVFGGTVSAMQRFDLQAAIGVGITALRAIAIVGALGAGWGLVGLALIQLGTSVFQGAIQYALTRKLYPELRFGFRGLERSQIKKIFAFSMYSSLLYVSNELIFSADSAVIGAFLPVAMITYFAIGSTLTDYTRSIIRTIAQTVTPRASALQGLGAMEELERVLLRAGGMATLVALPLTITFIVRGETFIGLWMGASYAATSGQILLILSVALSFAAARQVVMSGMIGMNRHRRLAPFYLAEGILNLALSVYWIHSLGLLGVALGTAVPNLVTTVLAIPWLVREAIGTRLVDVWTRMWLRPLAAMIPFAMATYAIDRLWPAHGLVVFFAGVTATLPFAGAGAWFIGFSSGERRALTNSVRGWLAR